MRDSLFQPARSMIAMPLAMSGGGAPMQHAYVAVAMVSLGWGVCSSAADEVVPGAPSSDTPVIQEVLVEAREPKYAAPTLRDRIGRVWVPVSINGKGPFRLVLDTGATASAVVQSVVDRLGLQTVTTSRSKLQGATGAAIVPHVTVDQMGVGDLLLNDAKLLIVPDVFGGAEGVLGAQGLADKRVYIDFGRDAIAIEFARQKPRPAGFSTVRFGVARGRLVTLELSVGGVRTKAVIDTGAQQTIGNNSLRDALLLRKREVREEQVIGVTMDVAPGQSIRTPPITIGTIEVHNLRITFGDMSIFEHWKLTREPALLIGMDVLGTLDAFVIDYPRKELHLRARR